MKISLGTKKTDEKGGAQKNIFSIQCSIYNSIIGINGESSAKSREEKKYFVVTANIFYLETLLSTKVIDIHTYVNVFIIFLSANAKFSRISKTKERRRPSPQAA